MKKIWNVTRSEYICWLMQPRILIIGVLILFTHSLTIEPLMERAAKMGTTLNSFEPFVAIGNSGKLVMLIPFVFLILLSDYPRMSSNNMLLLSRTGKNTWLWGQIIFLALAILTYLAAILIGSIAISGINLGCMEWSDAVTKYDSVYPEEYGNFNSLLLPSNLYNQMSLAEAVISTFCYLFVYLLFLSLILYFFKLLHTSTIGLMAIILIIACGVLTCALRTKAMWLFPMAHTITWLHYDEILQKPLIPLAITNGYWIICISIGVIGNRIALKRYSFLCLDERR